MSSRTLQGLIAATITPFHPDGSVDYAAIGPMLDRLIGVGIAGFYVCGSTYNIAAPLYRRIMDAVTGGNLQAAQELQHHSAEMVRVMCEFPFHGSLKATMEMLGMPGGPCRLPLRGLTSDEKSSLKNLLSEIGYFDWCGIEIGGVR